MIRARLHPIWTGGSEGYRYSVVFDGQLLVERSRDPEYDAARALLAKGITGKLTLLDGKTGKPWIIIDIERAARLTAEETNSTPIVRGNEQPQCWCPAGPIDLGQFCQFEFNPLPQL